VIEEEVVFEAVAGVEVVGVVVVVGGAVGAVREEEGTVLDVDGCSGAKVAAPL